MRLINTEKNLYIATAKRGQLGRIFKTQKHARAVIYIKTNQSVITCNLIIFVNKNNNRNLKIIKESTAR